MFCNNVNYQTEPVDNNCSNYCKSPINQNQPVSYNYLPTQQSQRNPSNLYKPTNRQPYQTDNLYSVNEMQTLQLMNQNTRRQVKRLQVVERNKNLSTVLSIVLAFSERIQALKEKICGYPAESFSPVQFFNVLDLTQKGYVDSYDVKRFVNNERIRDKDIIALFKRVNGDHAKDNTRLTYFGYLNLIKPYFNQQLARDLLLRDKYSAQKANRKSNTQHTPQHQINTNYIQPTQQSVLLLFQQLMLLHCICATQHQQSKQLLMNQYMLNPTQIKQIIGLTDSQEHSRNPSSLSPQKKHKTPLAIVYEFIENNSQFEIEFKDMKFLLSFLNVHEFSLASEKCLGLLFLPINCKTEVMRELTKQNLALEEYEGKERYMKAFLTKENLMNRGNIQTIKDYLEEKAQLSLSGQHVRSVGHMMGTQKANFLEFVHPRSLQRAQPIQSPHIASQHPQIYINNSNKHLSPDNYNPSQRQYSNNSSIPQENIKINPPRQTLVKQDQSLHHKPVQQYRQTQQLRGQFYEDGRQDRSQNQSNYGQTPFLEQFMKKERNLKGKGNVMDEFRKNKINPNDSNISSSGMSSSAFEVVDYGYEASKEEIYRKANQRSSRYQNTNQKVKKETLDNRYNMVVSQYRNNNQPQSRQNNNLFRIDENVSYSKNLNQRNHENQSKSSKPHPQLNIQNPILDYSRGNYLDAVGMSQSNMVNQSTLPGRNISTNILNQFLKKP